MPVLRYPSPVPREIYTFDDLELDVEAATLARDGRRLELPQLSFELLVALLRRAPDVVSTDELVATVWKGVAVSNETLTQRVALLRRVLGDEAQNPRYVRAVRGRGYQLIPALQRRAEAARPARDAAPSRRRQLVGLALAGVVGLGAWAFLRHEQATSLPAGQLSATPSTRPAQAAELVARAGTYLERHQEADNERAVELYRHALELAPTDPDALAGLSLALSQRSTKFNQPTDPEAETLARRALELAPGSGRALHALALALDSQGRLSAALAAYLEAAQRDDAPAPVLASAAHLLQVSGRLAEALETNLRAAQAAGPAPHALPIYLEVQLGTTLRLLGFAAAAEVWFERSLELRPDNVFAASAFAHMRLAQGRAQEADALASRALERGVRRPELHQIRSLVALGAGRLEDARVELDRALSLDSADYSSRTRRACYEALQGLPAEAEQLATLVAEARNALEKGDTWPSVAYDLMLLEAASGRPEAALAALDRALELGWRDGDWLLVDPMLAAVRAQPGFAARLERLRLWVEAERQRVLGAPWLPAGFLAADGPPGSAASR